MQLGAFLCERKNKADVYCQAVYCFTIGFKLLMIMKGEILFMLLKALNVSIARDGLTCMKWLLETVSKGQLYV